MRASRLAVLCTLATLVTGCGDRDRDEARVFLAAYGRVNPDASFDARRAQLEALAAVEVATDEVRGAKDLCLRAHRALLEAERGSAEAREGLAAAGGESAPLSESTADALTDAIERSNRSLEQARELLPRCEERVLGLRGRFGRRR